jgi:hypothetical protein
MLPVTVAWLPAEEYAEWPEHWPDLADSALLQDEKHGGTVAHAVYCQRMERRLRELRETGMTRLPNLPLRSTDFTRSVADNDPGERDHAQSRAGGAAARS